MNASKSLRRRLIAVLAAITLTVLAAVVPSNSASAATKGWKWAKGFHVKHLQPLDNGLAAEIVDIEGRAAEPHVAAGLERLRGHVEALRVLGSFPAA